jgi:hypothetical protein
MTTKDIVTLLNEEQCERSACHRFSSDRGYGAPRVHRHDAKALVRSSGYQMASNVEGIVNGSVTGEELSPGF